ncbi:hypothetical protein DYB26_015200, partial [Aphanomyces astaci]
MELWSMSIRTIATRTTERLNTVLVNHFQAESSEWNRLQALIARNDVLMTSTGQLEPPEDDPDTADSYTSCDQCTVFVPSLAVPLLPHLRHIGTFTSVRLRKARLTYHPMTPLLTACT